MENMSCPVCSYPEVAVDWGRSGTANVDCPRCGNYEIEEYFIANSHKLRELVQPHILSGFIKEMNWREWEHIPKLDERRIKEIESLVSVPKDLSAKTDKLIEYLWYKSKRPGKEVTIRSVLDYPIIYSEEKDELEWYCGQHLKNLELAEGPKSLGTTLPGVPGNVQSQNYVLTLTAKGIQRWENLNKRRVESNQAFVAMAFTEPKGRRLSLDLGEVYRNGIAPAITEPGYDPMKIDLEHHNEKICDKIIGEIRKSKFMVADCTYHKQNVYYEAGFAHGLGMEVIWCCHRKDFRKPQFDVRQYAHILWESSQDLHKQLKDRIEATVGLSSKKR